MMQNGSNRECPGSKAWSPGIGMEAAVAAVGESTTGRQWPADNHTSYNCCQSYAQTYLIIYLYIPT